MGVDGGQLAEQPNAMQLYYFNALNDISKERTSTVVFPVPINLLEKLQTSS